MRPIVLLALIPCLAFADEAPAHPRAAYVPERAARLAPAWFASLDAGYMVRSQTLTATGGRVDVAKDFETNLGGLEINFGHRFGQTAYGSHRVGGAIGYYADHVSSGLLEFGANLFAAAASDGETTNDGNRIEVDDYRLRTETSAWPVKLFYDYEVELGSSGARVYAGPTIGFTPYHLATNFSGTMHDSTSTSGFYGVHAGVTLPVGDGGCCRLGYEYRRERDEEFDPGVNLRFSDRSAHLFTFGFCTNF